MLESWPHWPVQPLLKLYSERIQNPQLGRHRIHAHGALTHLQKNLRPVATESLPTAHLHDPAHLSAFCRGQCHQREFDKYDLEFNARDQLTRIAIRL